MELQLENAIRQTTPQVNSDSKEGLSEEEILQIESQGRRAVMWLSGYMKSWLKSEYLDFSPANGEPPSREELLSRLTTKVMESSPVPQVLQMFELLTIFTKTTQLRKHLSSHKELLEDFERGKQLVDSLGCTDELKTYLDLPGNQQVIDEDEMQQLILEFRHDIKNAGETTISMEQAEHVYNPLSKKYQHLMHVWMGIKESFDTRFTKEVYERAEEIREKKEAERILSDSDIASALLDMYDVLHAFNLESGGIVESPGTVTDLRDYVAQLEHKLTAQFPSLKITVDTEKVLESSLQKKTTLNVASLSRIITNALTNINRVFGEKKLSQAELEQNPRRNQVEIILNVGEQSVLVMINDHGPGFHDENGEPLIILNQTIKLYAIEMGKTHWENAQGTGTGLYGLKRLLEKYMRGKFYAGNRYSEGELEGASVVAIAPIIE